MKYLTRPEFTSIPQHMQVNSKAEFKQLDKVWKQIVKEDREHSETTGWASNFAPLSILRNLMLGRNVYTGFTPFLRPNCLQNGRSFIHGFHRAYRQLHWELGRNNPSRMQNDAYRMLVSVYTSPNIANLTKVLPSPNEFDGSWYNKSYISRVQTMIASEQIKGADLSEHTFTSLFEMFEKDHMYNVIRKEDYKNKKWSYEEFQGILKEFAMEWLSIQKIRATVISVDIKEDPSWMYVDCDGNDLRMQREMHSSIVIVTRDKYKSDGSDDVTYHVPVKHLWELEWLKEFSR